MKQKSSQSQRWGSWSQSPAHKSNKLDRFTWRSLLLKQGWLAGMKMNRMWSMLCWFPQLAPTKPELLHTGWYITWKIYSSTREQQMRTKTERVVDAFLTHLFQAFSGQVLSREFKQRKGDILLLLVPYSSRQKDTKRGATLSPHRTSAPLTYLPLKMWPHQSSWTWVTLLLLVK